LELHYVKSIQELVDAALEREPVAPDAPRPVPEPVMAHTAGPPN
jgi:hypothetical protein